MKTSLEHTRDTINIPCCHAICLYLKWVGQKYSHQSLETNLQYGINVMPILLLVYRECYLQAKSVSTWRYLQIWRKVQMQLHEWLYWKNLRMWVMLQLCINIKYIFIISYIQGVWHDIMLLSLYISMCNLRRFYLHYVEWSYTKLEFYVDIMFNI